MECARWNLLTPPSGVVVCIPVRNEQDHIARCLHALANQDSEQAFIILILLNNCTDRTADIIREFAASSDLDLRVQDRVLPPPIASAGYARHMAMNAARRLAGAGGVLLCTDADAVVPREWLRYNTKAIAAGVDAVFGRIEMDPDDSRRLPPRLHDDEAAAQTLSRLTDQIDSLIDPDPWDAWPRHAEHSGASIAVTCAAYDAAGGIPCIASSEDRAFFAALRRVDAKIRHDPEIVVTVSGRLDGRADGGMAETLKRRLRRPDMFLDDCIESAAKRQRRAIIRARVRSIHGFAGNGSLDWVRAKQCWAEMDLPVELFALLRVPGTFGALWQELERITPSLRSELVPAAQVELEIASAKAILASEISVQANRANSVLDVDHHAVAWPSPTSPAGSGHALIKG